MHLQPAEQHPLCRERTQQVSCTDNVSSCIPLALPPPAPLFPTNGTPPRPRQAITVQSLGGSSRAAAAAAAVEAMPVDPTHLVTCSSFLIRCTTRRLIATAPPSRPIIPRPQGTHHRAEDPPTPLPLATPQCPAHPHFTNRRCAPPAGPATRWGSENPERAVPVGTASAPRGPAAAASPARPPRRSSGRAEGDGEEGGGRGRGGGRPGAGAGGATLLAGAAGAPDGPSTGGGGPAHVRARASAMP